MKLRSLLFVPGDSEKKFAKATGAQGNAVADVLILDLEDAVAPSMKEAARGTVAGWIDRAGEVAPSLFVRVNPLGTGLTDVLMNARVAAMEASRGLHLMNLCHAAYSFGATRWQVMRHVIMPSAMPEILTAMRIGIGFGWTTLVAAEMVASTKGLGYMVLSASQFLQTPVVIMGIFVIAIIAFAFDLLMRFVERRLVPWKGRM